MQYNFEPLAKRLIGGKLFIDRNTFLRMGIKMINEDTSIELMNLEMKNMMIMEIFTVNFLFGVLK